MKLDLSLPLTMVLLEDDASDAQLIARQLARHGFNIHWRHALHEDDFRHALAHPAPDLVLADYTLPGFDGQAALRIVKQITPDIPFIFVSGSLGEERAIEALKSGATDYVLKDRLQRLPAVVSRALIEARERRERQRAQTALEAQRILLGTLIDSLPEIIFSVDAEQRITVVNQALLDALQLRREQALGQPLSQVWPDEHFPGLAAQLTQAIQQGRAVSGQERAWLGADGALRWFSLTHVPLRDRDDPHGLVCAIRDITARKALEQEILEISHREQRRLGSDLHDGLGQELTGLSLLLKGLEMQLEREHPQYLPQVEKIAGLLNSALQSTRSLARGLAPVNLEHGGLGHALKDLAARCTDIYALDCSFTLSGSRLPALQEAAATHIYRVAQEASTNAARHAQASRIHLELHNTGRRLTLAITDDGVGLGNASGSEQPGMGLKIMEYRARMIGGTVSFEQPARGTRVVLSAPLNLLRANPAARRAN